MRAGQRGFGMLHCYGPKVRLPSSNAYRKIYNLFLAFHLGHSSSTEAPQLPYQA